MIEKVKKDKIIYDDFYFSHMHRRDTSRTACSLILCTNARDPNCIQSFFVTLDAHSDAVCGHLARSSRLRDYRNAMIKFCMSCSVSGQHAEVFKNFTTYLLKQPTRLF